MFIHISCFPTTGTELEVWRNRYSITILIYLNIYISHVYLHTNFGIQKYSTHLEISWFRGELKLSLPFERGHVFHAGTCAKRSLEEGVSNWQWSGFLLKQGDQRLIGTLPKTNIFTENQWLEDDFSFWDALFSVAMLVSGGVIWTCWIPVQPIVLVFIFCVYTIYIYICKFTKI